MKKVKITVLKTTFATERGVQYINTFSRLQTAREKRAFFTATGFWR
jgi:hypothetical protein